MRLRNWTLGLTVVSLLLTAAPAFAKPKKAKPAAAASDDSSGSADTGKSKSVDDLMNDSATAKPKPAAAAGGDSKDDKDAEKPAEPANDEPDAWEKPPAEEEKAPAPPPKVVHEEKLGDGRELEVGLLVGWGFQTDKVFSVNPYNLGLGLRLGYEFDFHLFLGVGYQYFIGSSDTLNQQMGGANAGSVNATANYMFAHVEVGYDLWFGSVIFRPSVWLGMAFGAQDPAGINLGQKTYKDFFFAPGASVLYVLDAPPSDMTWFFGGDLRLYKVTGDGSSAVVLQANGGLRF